MKIDRSPMRRSLIEASFSRRLLTNQIRSGAKVKLEKTSFYSFDDQRTVELESNRMKQIQHQHVATQTSPSVGIDRNVSCRLIELPSFSDGSTLDDVSSTEISVMKFDRYQNNNAEDQPVELQLDSFESRKEIFKQRITTPLTVWFSQCRRSARNRQTNVNHDDNLLMKTKSHVNFDADEQIRFNKLNSLVHHRKHPNLVNDLPQIFPSLMNFKTFSLKAVRLDANENALHRRDKIDRERNNEIIRQSIEQLQRYQQFARPYRLNSNSSVRQFLMNSVALTPSARHKLSLLRSPNSN